MPRSRRQFVFRPLITVLGAITLVTLLWSAGSGLSQMTSGSRTSMPSRPLPPGISPPSIRFVDIAEKSGLNGLNVSGSDKQQMYIVENTGTGVAIFDYDADGLPDVFLVNGDRFDKTGVASTHFLYHNRGGLEFEDVTARSGITHTDWGQGVCAGDIDNDGRVDLFVTSWGKNHLWRNLGDGKFRDETAQRGLDAPKRWSTGCAFFDYDRDGNLDLFVAHYLAFDPAKVARPIDPGHCVWKGFPVVCGPLGLPPETMSLYHNDGHGHFTDVSEKAGISRSKGVGLTVLTGDFNNDGWPDVYVANDSAPSLYFVNKHDGTFEEAGALSALAYNSDGGEQSGMGAAAADYDHNGFLDIAKTNFSGDVPNLYKNIDGSMFDDASGQAGLAVHTQYVAWGVGFLDFDNDGWKDLLIANGHVYPDIDARGVDQSFRQPRLLYWNRRDGQFFDMSSTAGPGILTPHSSRGLALGDLDNDGRPEAVIVNMHERPSLLKCSGDRGNSILVRVLTRSGRDAIGARVTVTAGSLKQIDEVRSGGSYISQNDFRLHFGLGTATKADVSIRWPNGTSAVYPNLDADQLITITQDSDAVVTTPLRRERSERAQ